MEQCHVPIRQAYIDLHHVERRMPEDFLETECVSAVEDVLGRESVAHRVRRDADVLDAGLYQS